MIKHHLDDATLMSYAAGALPNTLAAVAAAHIDACPKCARKARDMDVIGSVFLEALAPAVLERAPPSALPVTPQHNHHMHLGPSQRGEVPAPLAALIGTDLDDVAWKRLGLHVWHAPVQTDGRGGDTIRPLGDLRLLKVGPGQAMPEHGHGGSELTLVLRGSYTDSLGTFAAGDIEDLCADDEHKPVADAKTGCICLIASDHPAVFKTFFARMVQPLTGF